MAVEDSNIMFILGTHNGMLSWWLQGVGGNDSVYWWDSRVFEDTNSMLCLDDAFAVFGYSRSSGEVMPPRSAWERSIKTTLACSKLHG